MRGTYQRYPFACNSHEVMDANATVMDANANERAGAKEMRILGWAERVAFINELPLHTTYRPGELHSFGDLVSRVTAMIGEAASAKEAATS